MQILTTLILLALFPCLALGAQRVVEMPTATDWSGKYFYLQGAASDEKIPGSEVASPGTEIGKVPAFADDGSGSPILDLGGNPISASGGTFTGDVAADTVTTTGGHIYDGDDPGIVIDRAARPATPTTGQIFRIVGTDRLEYHNGTQWVQIYTTTNPPSGTVEACSGGKLFSWSVENLTDVSTGALAGCSLGDLTPTVVGSASLSTAQRYDGESSLHSQTSSARVEFDAAGVIDHAAGTVTIAIHPVGSSGHVRLWRTYGSSGTNLIQGEWRSDNTIRLTYTGTGTTQYITTTDTITPGQWNTIIFKWNAAGTAGGSYLGVTINGGTEFKGTTPVTAWSSTPSVLEIGNSSSTVGSIYLDAVEIFDSWL